MGDAATKPVGITVGQPARTGLAVPAAAPRLAALTRLRLLLIGWVVLYHLDLTLGAVRDVPVLGPAIGRGYLGVDGFFLLSGFALWLGYHRRPPMGRAGWLGFLVRRLAKIWPLHALALLLLAALVGLAVAAGATVHDPGRFDARDLVLQMLLVNAWETTARHAWNYPSWALSAEFAGYLVFPLLLRGVARLPAAAAAALPALLLAALLGIEAVQLPGVGLNLTFHLALLRFFPEFLAGLALGRLATEGRLPRALPWLLLLALPAGLAFGLDGVAVAGLAGGLLLAWQAGAGAPAAAAPRDLAWRLGEASFGVYLCWVFVEAAVVALQRATPLGAEARLALMPLGLAANLALGWLAWRWVEVPAQRWLLARRG